MEHRLARDGTILTVRIAHIDTGRDFRGGQQLLLTLARGLRDRGHQQLIANRWGGQREKENCAFVDFRFHPNVAAMFGNDPLCSGQAHSHSFEVLPAVRPLEDSKKLIGVLHIKTHSVIPNKEHLPAPVQPASYLDHGRFSGHCVFDRIREQVEEYLLDQSRIAIDKG